MDTHLSLWGQNPLGYLASLGALLVVPGSRIRFSDNEYAIIDAAPSDLAAAIVADARDCAGAVGAMVGAAERIVSAAVAAQHVDATDVDMVGSPAERKRERARRKRELEVWQEHMANPRIGLDLTSGQGSISSAGSVLAESITAEDVLDLCGADEIEDTGRPLIGATLRLSHADARPYALQASASGASVPRVRVAASWLAWRAIVALPLLGHPYARIPAIPRADLALRWRLWFEPLGWAEASALATARERHSIAYASRIARDRYGYGSISPAAPEIVSVTAAS